MSSIHDSVKELTQILRKLLRNAVERNLTEGILLSGGLDTSILAFLASKFTSLKAYTVALNAEAPDAKYSTLVADYLGLKHYIYYFREEELYDTARDVIKIMRTFDPMEVRNDIAIHLGLKIAKEDGVPSIMTGDGSDELFAGYSFYLMMSRDQLDKALKKMWRIMSFSSIKLGEALGVEAKLPYLDPEFKSFAMSIDPSYKVRKERQTIYGKWILRKAFEAYLPAEIIWRIKMPIEQGSGTTRLIWLLNQKISDEEFEEKKERYLIRDKVRIRSKEQLFYYEIYRSVIGVPHPDNPEGKICPYCNSNVPEDSNYCPVCGAYPI